MRGGGVTACCEPPPLLGTIPNNELGLYLPPEPSYCFDCEIPLQP
jgi:hypothetical protein